MVFSTATSAFVGGSVVVAGLAGLVGSGGTALGSGAFSMMSLGFEQVRSFRLNFPSFDNYVPRSSLPEVNKSIGYRNSARMT